MIIDLGKSYHKSLKTLKDSFLDAGDLFKLTIKTMKYLLLRHSFN